MADTEVIVCDKFGKPYGNVKDATISDFEKVLCDVGSGSFTYNPLDVSDIKLVAREIQFWLDGKLRWWGIPRRRSGSPDSLTVECEGIEGHLHDRIVDDGSITFTAADQIAIWHDLIAFAQSEATQPNRNLNYAFSAYALSGVLRSRIYDRNDHKDILELIKEFPTLSNGFEWELQIFEDGRRWWTPYYPRKGSVIADHELYWENGGEVANIATFAYNEDAVNIGTHGYITGGSSGDVKFEQNFEDVAASAEYGLRQFVISDSDQMDVGWLLEEVTEAVDERKVPIMVPAVTIPRYGSDGEDMLDVFTPGDTAVCHIDHGDIQQNGNYRIGRVKWDSSDNITLTFIGEDAG